MNLPSLTYAALNASSLGVILEKLQVSPALLGCRGTYGALSLRRDSMGVEALSLRSDNTGVEALSLRSDDAGVEALSLRMC